MSDNFSKTIHSYIWEEIPNQTDPHSAQICYCRGYDVFGDLLGKASYIEYLHLLFKGERPTEQSREALEMLAVALANPGPRDPSVHAAMAAGVGGSTAASALMAALASGAGSYGGGREVFLILEALRTIGKDISAWRSRLATIPQSSRTEVWPEVEHQPGFEPYSEKCRTPVLQLMNLLSTTLPNGYVAWLACHRSSFELIVERPLAMPFVIAAILADLNFSPAEGEMLTLLLRLPGAAAHALEQQNQGFRNFPFFALKVENDPGAFSERVEQK